MVDVREVSVDQWETLRDIRLVALKDAPWAFGSSHERESAFGEEQWRGRINSRGATFFAYLDEPSPPGSPGSTRRMATLAGLA